MNRLLRGPADRGRSRGLTLIELMVAIAIGLVILGFLVTLYVNVSRNNNEMARMNRQIENGRFAIQLMQNDLVHAGFWADYMPQFEDRNVAAPADVPNAVPNPCQATTAAWDAVYRSNLIGIPVQDTVGTCAVVTSPDAASDVLVVRHAEPVDGFAAGACPANQVCFQASQCSVEINAGAAYRLGSVNNTTFDRHNKVVSGAPPAQTCSGAGSAITSARRLVSNIYYVRDDGVLMRSEYNNGAQVAAQPLIEGIERLHVEYGIDNVGRNGAAVSYTGVVNRGDGIPDTYVSCAPCTAAQLTNAVAVRLYVVARSLEATPGYTDGKTYTLGAVTHTVPAAFSRFKRHVFTTTVRLVNPSGRRETP